MKESESACMFMVSMTPAGTMSVPICLYIGVRYLLREKFFRTYLYMVLSTHVRKHTL